MKTLLFTLEYPPFHGGVANYYGHLAKYWPEPADILVLDNAGDKLISKKLPVLKWLPSIWRLFNSVRKEKIGHILVGQILPLGLPAWLVAKISGTGYSVILHGTDLSFALKSKRKKKLAGCLLKSAKKIICANAYVALMAQDNFGDHLSPKTLVVTPGVDEPNPLDMQAKESLIRRYDIQGKPVLLSIGRLVKRKGVDMVLEAMPSVLEKIPQLRYVIIGSGDEEKNIRAKITGYSLDDSVTLITDAQDVEKDCWLDICSAFIMPSRIVDGDLEGFGIVYLEANLFGKPVIAGDSGGVRVAVEDGVSGLLVNPEDKYAIAEAIVRLVSNRELNLSLGTRGKERALKNFQWQDRIRAIYNAINI